MRQIVFYFDVASPLAWLAFEQLPQALAGVSYWVEYRPVSRAALLAGPATDVGTAADAEMHSELIAAQPLADALNIRIVPPPSGFDSRPLLHLALACSPPGAGPNRFIVERLMHHVWRAEGSDPSDPERLAALLAVLAPARSLDAAEVRDELDRANGSAAADGISRVPAFAVPSLARWFDSADALQQLAQALAAGR